MNSSDHNKILIHRFSELISGLGTREIYLNSNGLAFCLNSDNQIKETTISLTGDELMDVIWQLAWDSGVRLDPFNPHGGGVVRGYNLRWHAVIPPAAPDGPVLVLRKQGLLEIDLGSFCLENFEVDDLRKWPREGMSVIFYGATGCGKTAAMFATLKRHFQNYRIGIVESVFELPLLSKFWFRLVEVNRDVADRGGVSLKKLVAEMLRLSPQMIVLGEIRTDEAPVWNELKKTGHGGVLTTFHAGCQEEVSDRLLRLLGESSLAKSKVMGIQVTRGHDGKHVCRATPLI